MDAMWWIVNKSVEMHLEISSFLKYYLTLKTS